MATNTALHADDITQLGYVALQNYLKNKPIDQVATERPLLKALMAKKKPWGGGKENIVEQIRTGYDNNFEWFGDTTGGTVNTSSAVTYNTRDTVRQAYSTKLWKYFDWDSRRSSISLCISMVQLLLVAELD